MEVHGSMRAEREIQVDCSPTLFGARSVDSIPHSPLGSVMSKYLCLTLLTILCAGCAQDWRPESSDRRSTASQLAADSSVGLVTSDIVSRRRALKSFANLPDQGDLVGYPKQRVVRHDGAYTWHRADISEAHAFRAVVDGNMRITTPSGEVLDFRYERHVEHPSGDWTWIGRIKRGAESDEAVVTFGDRAAFGSISQPGKAPLNLTIRDGVAWLIETDRSKIATIDNPATKPTAPDYLVPPQLAVGSIASASNPSTEASSAMPVAAAAAAAATTTVDVLLGYTNGFAAAYGGQSQAVTRLNHLVQMANEAYANSQLDARIRLVHAMQVTYPDATDNGDTLEKLTGYRSGAGSIPVDPAFNALRAAREQYGADLVSLVRDFRTPENAGCGIAWLIGGGRTGIASSDAPFGYSVVSDGNDAGTDGKDYFCRVESLAHELGHNMGSQHDRVTATVNGVLNYGAYDYSFGYKTGAGAGNFYTVMAYGDVGQTDHRIFSNPRATTFCGGLACGIAGQADNARSLQQTMPIVATFRAGGAVVGRVGNDFNGDGRSDILWRNSSTGANVVWRSASSQSQQAMTQISDLSWKIVGVGDFNGDRVSDVLWRHSKSGANVVWLSANRAASLQLTTIPVQDWKVAGVGDFNGDGRADILWRHATTGAGVIWRSGSYADQVATKTINDLAWKIVGIGDFNGDGFSDVFWRNAETGANVIWRSGNFYTQQRVATVPDLAWKVVGSGDFNGDGVDDVTWRNMATGANTIWRSAWSASQQPMATVPDLAWVVANVGDYDGDRRSDVLWRNTVSGANTIWRSGSNASLQGVGTVPSQSWQVMGNL